MDDVRPLPPVGREHLPKAFRFAQSHAATLQRPSDDAKSFRLDRGTVAVDAGHHDDVEAHVAGGPSHREPVRDEIPILGDEVEDLHSAAWLAERRAWNKRASEERIEQPL